MVTHLAGPLSVTVDGRLLDRAPGYVLGLIAIPDIEVTAGTPAVAALLSAAEDTVHQESLSKADVSALPTIAAWRDAYRGFGANPSRFPCAAESLLRRVAKGERLPRINALVDLCNGVSLAERLPVASCDAGGLGSALTVGPAEGSEVYLPLGAPDAAEHPDPGEIVYADAQGRAHSRRWNWRQGDLIKTDRGRRRLLITVEAVHDGGRQPVARALRRIGDVLDGLTDTWQRPVVLDRSAPSGELFTASSPAR